MNYKIPRVYTCKEKGPRTAKLALFLINIMKYGIVQFLLHK